MSRKGTVTVECGTENNSPLKFRTEQFCNAHELIGISHMGVDITEGGAVDAPAAAASAAAPKVVVNVVDTSSLLYVLGAAVLSALICEAISWWLVYSREDYERLSNTFKKASKRLEKKKKEEALAGPPPASGKGGKGKDKKLIALEREFEYANRDLMALKSRSGMLTALVHLVTFFNLKASYDGVVLARLPFEPFSMIAGMSHRNIPGIDSKDCGFIFIYMLCSLCIKPNLQHMLGHTPPKTAIPKGIEQLAERWAGIAEPEDKKKK